jgi:hypothetical protein
MASKMSPSPRKRRYSGSDLPAWRMNHTGVRPVGEQRHARRKGESAVFTARQYPGPGTSHIFLRVWLDCAARFK